MLKSTSDSVLPVMVDYIAAGRELKSFLRRHPRIRGRTRTEQVVHDMARNFNDVYAGRIVANAYSCELVRQQTCECLTEMQSRREIASFKVDMSNFPTTIEITVQPMQTVELVVLDFTIA
jgi:hypothetical protein